MDYDYYKEKNKSGNMKKIIFTIIIAGLIILLMTAAGIYMEIIQLDEIGGFSSIYITNLIYKAATFGIAFIIIFAVIALCNNFIKRNMNSYFKSNEMPAKRLPNLPIAAIIGFLGALISKDAFYEKLLSFMNSTAFNVADPIFGNDIGYYIFTRPFFTTIYSFLSALWVFAIIYNAIYYLVALSLNSSTITVESLKIKSVITHNLVNIAVFFIIKAFSYQLVKQDMLYGTIYGDVTGAGYVDVNIWLKYYSVAPFILVAIVAVALFLLLKGRLKHAAIAIGVFPAMWLIVIIISLFVKEFIVSPNEYDYQKNYIVSNMEKTREAYNLNSIKTHDFPNMQSLTPEIINSNIETKNNIRIVDIPSTLISNVQLQSNTAFYTFSDGDIINYNINGKDTPIFISAREIDKSKLPDSTYLNTTYRYTHGYGIVMNPINRVSREGQVDFILSGLINKSSDPSLVINRPEIYYGEMTEDHVIVKAKGLDEIDYDGNRSTTYSGKGGIQLDLMNKLLFAVKYADLKMLISGYTSDATLLLNRDIINRAQKALPFLIVDKDPYILLTDDGTLKWVVDAYTATDKFPYAQSYSGVNYIRNSVKIVIDAYDGKLDCYIIDKTDPIIQTYAKIYPGVLKDEPLPQSITKHMRYPEMLFKIQTEMLNRYHILPDDVSKFYTKQDLWAIARYSKDKNASSLSEIEPYYNMIKLPDGIGDKEELILMRPFTPAGELKHNMVSWLAVRNSNDNYGEMILFNFPKNQNILGPNQVEVKINQIAQISQDMTLWGQSGSDVYKGNLLVIPIENSVLYVEPIYIKANSNSSIPEVKEIVVGYQSADEFRYGIGQNLDLALKDLFNGEGNIAPTDTGTNPPVVTPDTTSQGPMDPEKIAEIKKKYDELKKQLDELGGLIDSLEK